MPKNSRGGKRNGIKSTLIDIIDMRGKTWSEIEYELKNNRQIIKRLVKEKGIRGFDPIKEDWERQNAMKPSDFKAMSMDETIKVYQTQDISDNVLSGWFRNADSSYKPAIQEKVVSNHKLRNVAMNIAWHNYNSEMKNQGKKEVSFDTFLNKPVKLYRGTQGQKLIDSDVFSSYSFDKKIAEKFAGKYGKVNSITVKMKDTYGSLKATAESEVMVPTKKIK